MTAPAAGWYPDPAGSGGQRWWNGSTWGEQVQPAPQQAVQSGVQWPAAQQQGAPGQQWAPQQQQWAASQQAPHWGAQQAPQGFLRRNGLSLASLVSSALLVVLAATAGIVVIAVLPIFLAVAAVKNKEQLAWPAVGVAAAVAIFALINFA